MSKYWETAKVLFKSQLVYRFDVGMTGLATLGRVLFAWILWGVIFSGRESIGGFTYEAMLSYYVVVSFLTSMELSEGISREVSASIRGGTFSKFMVIPSNPQLTFLSRTLGAAGYYTLFSLAAAALCTLVFQIPLTFSDNAASLLCALIMVPLGLVFMISYQFFIGILAFLFQDVSFFLYVQMAIISFATGTIVPLSLLPEAILRVLRFLPFTYVTYTPAMLLTGQMGLGEGVAGLAILAVWTVGMLLMSELTYRHLRMKFDGVGI